VCLAHAIVAFADSFRTRTNARPPVKATGWAQIVRKAEKNINNGTLVDCRRCSPGSLKSTIRPGGLLRPKPRLQLSFLGRRRTPQVPKFKEPALFLCRFAQLSDFAKVLAYERMASPGTVGGRLMGIVVPVVLSGNAEDRTITLRPRMAKDASRWLTGDRRL
jgi:hypothetical protein